MINWQLSLGQVGGRGSRVASRWIGAWGDSLAEVWRRAKSFINLLLNFDLEFHVSLL